MSKLKRLSGKVTKEGKVQSLTIPKHKELDKGTLKTIIRQAARFVPYEELEKEFYTER